MINIFSSNCITKKTIQNSRLTIFSVKSFNGTRKKPMLRTT